MSRMVSLSSAVRPRARRGLASAAVAAVAFTAAGCASGSLDLAEQSLTAAPVETGSIARSDLAPAAAGGKPAAPAETAVSVKPAVAQAIEAARKLRHSGRKPEALAALDKAAETDPKDKALAKERGLVALELGRVQQAEALLRKAFDPAAPDWRLHSGLGAALAAQGKQGAAQLEFAKALELAPDHPSVLNNLALSYALDGKHEDAEKLLRRIARDKGAEPRAGQNLALILGLKGRTAEARQVSRAVLPEDKASANAAYLERLGVGGERASVSRAEPAVPQGVADAANR